MGISPRQLVVAVLLSGAVGCVGLATVGLVTMRNVFDRLHFQAVASTAGPALVAAAVVVRYGASSTTLKALIVTGTVLITGPVVTHAMGRGARAGRAGEIEIKPGERVDG